MGGCSTFFTGYQGTLRRVMFTEMLDTHLQKQQQRRLSIVGPCYTHEQWLVVQAERQQRADCATESTAASLTPIATD